MSRRNWLPILALVGLTFLTGAGQPEERPPSKDAPGNAQQVEPLPAPALPPEAYTPYPEKQSDNCYYDQNHDAADLCAQWRAAIAAENAANATVIGNWIGAGAGALSFVSLLIAFYSLWQTRKALADSREANGATLLQARRGADAAVKAADVERGFIFVKPSISWGQQTAPKGYQPHVGSVFCMMKNYGRSPVIVRQVEIEIRTLSKPSEPDNTLQMAVTTFPGGEVMEPLEERIFPSRKTLPFTAEEFKALKSGSAFVWYYGCVTYEDVFGTARYTRFRWMDNRLANSFAPNGGKPYNERT